MGENPDEVYAQNVRIVACQVIQTALERVDWEDFPDLGEHDWSEVYKTAQELLSPWPLTESYQAAYDWLSTRADHGGRATVDREGGLDAQDSYH